MFSRPSIAAASLFRIASLLIVMCAVSASTLNAASALETLATTGQVERSVMPIASSVTQSDDRQPERGEHTNELDIGKRRRAAEMLLPVDHAPSIALVFDAFDALISGFAITDTARRNSVPISPSIRFPLLASRLSACRGRAPPAA